MIGSFCSPMCHASTGPAPLHGSRYCRKFGLIRLGTQTNVRHASMTKRNDRRRYALPALDLLPTFEAAARTLSFTKAAEELFITQSAVSKQLKQLERQLGLRLFERKARALLLTEAGRTLQVQAVDTLDRLQTTVDHLQRENRGAELTVTMTTGFASMWLIPRLDRFTARHPRVHVRLSATTAVLDLERERIDLA